MKDTYRLIISENSNEQGHIIPCKVSTARGARIALRRELKKYGGNGAGRVEYLRGTYYGMNVWDKVYVIGILS